MKWTKASESIPKDQVLVVCLRSFFGGCDAELTVGYYDDPKDYKDPSEGKGWLDWNTGRPLTVTHWAVLPKVPKSEVDGMDLTEFVKKFGDARPNLGTVLI